MVQTISSELENALALPALAREWSGDGRAEVGRMGEVLLEMIVDDRRWLTLLGWILVHRLGDIVEGNEAREQAR